MNLSEEKAKKLTLQILINIASLSFLTAILNIKRLQGFLNHTGFTFIFLFFGRATAGPGLRDSIVSL